MEQLKRRFEYCFTQVHDYPPILDAHELTGPLAVGKGEHRLRLTPLEVDHGRIRALGFLVGTGVGPDRLAYIPDVSELPEAAFARLRGIDVLIVDALRYRPHPSHAHLERTLGWIERIAPASAILTNLHIDFDYATLAAELPEGVEPAHDGLEIDL